MSLKYSERPELSKAIAYFVFRKKQINYESIRKRFERFDEKLIRRALKETARSPPLVIFDRERNIYQPSAYLKGMLNIL